jgi:hypothetical protein
MGVGNRKVAKSGAPVVAEERDSELVFLSELLNGYKYWKALAEIRTRANMKADREHSYADAYRVLLNRFTVMEVQDHE